MGKGRFTALDVTAMTTSLQNILIGTRVANIYDINARTYLLKFSGGDKRLFLIIESGIRFHCTTFQRELSSMPNHFASKLRKYLRSKKLTSIKQIGRDRIVILTFGVQETHKFYLIIELYAGGNIVLCDYEYNIIISLRVHQDNKTNITIKPGEKYPISFNKDDKRTDNKQEIEEKLRNCIARLIKQNYKKNHNQNNNKKKLSNRQRRKQRMNHKMETINDFIMKIMSASPNIVNSIINKFKINKNESLLNYVMRPYPILKPEKLNKNNESSTESSSESDDDEEHEDDMYCDMNEEEKINAMRLNNDKFNVLIQCFIGYEKLIESLQGDKCNGYIISKQISLAPTKTINIFVKKARKKQMKPVIDLENDDGDDNNNNDDEEKKEEKKQEKEDEIKWVYDEFIPFKIDNNDINGNKVVRIEEFNTFNECVDEFYSSHEAIKNETKQSRAEMLAFKKLETAKNQHLNRINQLQSEADNKSFYASIIEENLDLVDKAINGINTLLSQGIDWNDLGNRIREETQFGNPIASIITSLKLHQNTITLKLKHEIQIKQKKHKNNDNDNDEDDAESSLSDMFGDDEDNDDDDDQQQEEEEEEEEYIQIKIEYYKIDIDIGLSAWNNARRYYAMKKQLLDKKDKTLDATNKALKAAENKTKSALKEAKQTAKISKLRKTYWFEKFFWFITSDGFLVIAGRDAQQNEIIVKKYMDKKRDIYVHALIHGASSVIIKNPSGLTKLPPRTINEAGAMCVCRSKAWNNNVSTQAYWVYGYQVSKTPQSGQYLPTGSFVIRGKRNFINQQPLQMGVTLLFRIDSNSQQLYHKNIRQMNFFDNDEDKTKKYGDVTQQFILDDIDNDDDEDQDNTKSMKKKVKNEENTIYVTKTMIQSSIKKKKQFEEDRRIKKLKEKGIDVDNEQKNDDDDDNDNDKNKKSKKSKTDKKLAKYGFDNKNKGDRKLSKREKNKRKKRGKYNRMYDEKDRKLVEQLLGVKPKNVKKENEENDGDDNEDKQKKEELKQNEPKEGYELNENPMNLNRNQQQQKETDINNEENGDDENEEEEEEEEEDEYDKQRKFAIANRLEDELKLLTGKLNENDTILYCMVMCAPYQCLNNKDEYEYKIKIQPGTNKRGRAVKFVMGIFENMCKASALNEKLNLLSLCKAIKETEINHIFLSNVKISAPGIKTLQIQQKKLQKQKQKEKWKLQQKQQQSQQSKNKGYNPSTNPKKRKKRK